MWGNRKLAVPALSMYHCFFSPKRWVLSLASWSRPQNSLVLLDLTSVLAFEVETSPCLFFALDLSPAADNLPVTAPELLGVRV